MSSPDTPSPTSDPRSVEASAPPKPRRATPGLYRVVEVVVDAHGRLQAQGRIWHPDLDRARRFGRALAGNSAAQQVLVAGSDGVVVERLPLPPLDAPAAGWSNWEAMPLPPAPPPSARKPMRRLGAPKRTAAPPAPTAPPAPPLPSAPAPAAPSLTLDRTASLPAAIPVLDEPPPSPAEVTRPLPPGTLGTRG